MARRVFDHLVLELSVATGCALPRYALWLRFRERGFDPEDLSRSEALAFFDDGLAEFLDERGLRLPLRAWTRVRRALARFDPHHPTPYERFART